MEGLPLPHELVFKIAAHYLDDPRDRLNFALACRLHKHQLLDGTNAAHLFWDVRFGFFAMRDMWDMLQFRELKEYDAFVVLTNVSAPGWMVDRALERFGHFNPALEKVLRLVRDDRPGLDCSELIFNHADHFCGMSLIFIVAVRYESVNTMSTILGRYFKRENFGEYNNQFVYERQTRNQLATDLLLVVTHFNSPWAKKLCRQYGLRDHAYHGRFGYGGAWRRNPHPPTYRYFDESTMISVLVVVLWILALGRMAQLLLQ